MLQTPAATKMLFIYKVEDFFNLSSTESMYRANTDTDSLGLPTLDYHALTNDDQAFFRILLRRAVADCYAVLQPLSKGVYEGLIYDSVPKRTLVQINAGDNIAEGIAFEMLTGGNIVKGGIDVSSGDKVILDNSLWSIYTGNEKYIIFTLGIPWNFDQNNLFGVDEKIKELISVTVVKEWFKRQKYDPQFIQPEHAALRADLGRILSYRASASRKVRTF